MKRSRLRQVSDKRRQELRRYTTDRRAYLTDHPLCQICQNYKSFDIHHRSGREGRKLLDREYWLAVCRKCHQEIHDNPRRARELGYIVN